MSDPAHLVAKRHYVPVALAERGDALQAAFRLREHSHRAVAINSVAVIGEVPAAALASCALCHVGVSRRLRWWQAIYALQRKR